MAYISPCGFNNISISSKRLVRAGELFLRVGLPNTKDLGPIPVYIPYIRSKREIKSILWYIFIIVRVA